MAANIQVPIELIGVGVASSASQALVLRRSEIGFDTNDYDGSPTYYLEICGQNIDNTARTVSLMSEPSAGTLSVSGVNFSTATDGADGQFSWTDATSGLVTDGNYAVALNNNAFAANSNSLLFTNSTSSPLSAIPINAIITNIAFTVNASGSLASDGLWKAGLVLQDGTTKITGATLYNQQTMYASAFTPTYTFQISGTPAMWQWSDITISNFLSGGFYMNFYLANQNDVIAIDGVTVKVYYEEWDTIGSISVPVTSGATWSGATNYSAGAVVAYLGLLWVAIQGPPNQNKAPSSQPTYWQKQDATRYRSGALTLPSGNKRYRLLIPATTSSSQLTLVEARLIVNQTNATKTRIQIPIVDGKTYSLYGVGETGVNTYVTSKSLGGSGPANANDNGHGTKWNYNLTYYADYAAGNCMTFEAIKYDDSYENGSHYATLWDATSGSVAEVTAARLEFSSYGFGGIYDGILPVRRSVDFNNVSYLTSSHDYQWKTAYDNGNNNDFTQEVRLYVRLQNLTKAELYWRLVKATASGKGPVQLGQSKMLLDTSLYSSPKFYLESTGSDATTENNLQLMDLGATYDSAQGQPGAAVTGSILQFAGTNQLRRSGALTLTTGHRYGVQQILTTANASSLTTVLVIQVTGAVAVTTRPFFMVVG